MFLTQEEHQGRSIIRASRPMTCVFPRMPRPFPDRAPSCCKTLAQRKSRWRRRRV